VRQQPVKHTRSPASYANGHCGVGEGRRPINFWNGPNQQDLVQQMVSSAVLQVGPGSTCLKIPDQFENTICLKKPQRMVPLSRSVAKYLKEWEETKL
jgi:hypothetical protein